MKDPKSGWRCIELIVIWPPLMGRGSAGEECRGMGRGLVGARLRVRGSSSVGARLRGMGSRGGQMTINSIHLHPDLGSFIRWC